MGIVSVDSNCRPSGEVFVDACLTARSGDKEYTIRTALGNSMPNKAFSLIKDIESVKDAWAILKSTYEDHTAVLVLDHMQAFQDTKCPEGGNICAHFHQLALLCNKLALLGQTY
jgi:hypothetical protein